MAAAISLILGPFLRMCYVSNGILAVAYLVVYILLVALPFIIAQAGIFLIHPVDALPVVSWGLNIVGAVHAFRIAKEDKYPEPIKWYSRWYVLIAIIVVPAVIAFAFRQFYFEPFHSVASSMSPNINKGDYLFVKKFAYNSQNPERGDVIIFRIDNVNYIRRIIGLPGEAIKIVKGVPYINNVALVQTEYNDESVKMFNEGGSMHQFTERLPEGREYRILFDSNISDVENTGIYAVAADSYFVMGDNRDHSQDSRYQDVGFVPRQKVIGKATIIFWNESKKILEWGEIK